jgi:hypothetical protein
MTQIIDKIKTIDDLLQYNNIDKLEFERKYSQYTKDERAYVLLKLLVRTFNEDWICDWNNINQSKYYIWFRMGGSSGFQFHVYDSWFSISTVGSRLHYKSKELVEYIMEQEEFVTLYKDFMLE